MFCNCSIIWPLFWFLGSFILGYLLRRALDQKYRKQVGLLEGEVASLKAKLAACEDQKDKPQVTTTTSSGNNPEIHRLRARISELEAQLLTSNTKANELQAEIDRLMAGGGVLGAGSGSDKDDLKRIEGIGPKIQKLLYDDGITTFNTLAKTKVDRLQGILDNAGSRYRIHDPTSWPIQAGLAAAGKWDELDKLQDELIGGRTEGRGGGITASGISTKDDLKKVEGIGPKIESLLNDDGIHTWRQLSEAPISRLKEILDAAGSRYRIHDPGTWPRQAGLAADGKWDELEKLQDELKGGRE